MKKIGLIGFFGWGNFGDELFLEVYKEYFGKDFELEVIHNMDKKPYFTKPVKEVIAKYDALIIGGGDLVIPWNISELYWKEEYLDKPVYIIGIGVPTWGKEKEHIVNKMRNFFQHDNVKKIITRDIESAKWIQRKLSPKVLIEYHADIVCALSIPKIKENKEKILGIVTRYRKNNDDDYTQLLELCHSAVNEGYKIHHIILAMDKTGRLDKETADKFIFEGKQTVYTESLEEQMIAIGRCTVLASMKFHGSVVATMYGIPSIVLSPTDKSRNLMRIIDRTDLLSNLNDKNLSKHFSPYMAKHSKIVTDYLKNDALTGLMKLKNELDKL
jgi:polysaccharide pyruvyl transferase WcaK-like protein